MHAPRVERDGFDDRVSIGFIGVFTSLLVDALFGVYRVCAFFVVVSVRCLHDLHCLSVVCLSVDGFGGMLRWGIVHGVGKAMWM